MAIQITKHPLPALAEIAAGRDHVSTDEFAHATNRACQTIRKNYCLTGECFGIRPIKCGNRLLWPVAAIVTLLNGAPPSHELDNQRPDLADNAVDIKRCIQPVMDLARGRR